MSVHVPISFGELLDKITILEIKSERLTSPPALSNVRVELTQLSIIIQGIKKHKKQVTVLKTRLKHINEKLWDIENQIRNKEAQKSFDQEFIELARSVYRHNDERGRIKREINLMLNSDLVEEKQYSPY